MKIIVAHSDRQYCNELLILLRRKGWLRRFYTLFAANRLGPLRTWLPKRLRNELRKREFREIPAALIRHFPLLYFWQRLSRPPLEQVILRFYSRFDRKVAVALRRSDFDLIVTYENANLETMRTARALGKTTVLDLAQIHHDDIIELGKRFMPAARLETEKTLINPRKAEALRYTDYVLTLSSFAAESVRRHGFPAGRVFTVNLGIDPQRFTPKPQYNATGPLRLLFVGTMTLRKGLAVLLETVRRLQDCSLELTLIGPMDNAQELFAQYAGHFRYLPFLHHEELVEHYRQADLFVFPSLLDSWAQTVLEAMACGTPAIVSEHTGAKDAVAQGGGWIVPTGNIAALEQQIRYCLAHRDAVESTGRAAHRIAQQYTWDNYHRQLAETFLEIARRENLPA